MLQIQKTSYLALFQDTYTLGIPTLQSPQININPSFCVKDRSTRTLTITRPIIRLQSICCGIINKCFYCLHEQQNISIITSSLKGCETNQVIQSCFTWPYHCKLFIHIKTYKTLKIIDWLEVCHRQEPSDIVSVAIDIN